MKAVSYEIRHIYQPSPTSCSPTALAMLLSYYGMTESAQSIMNSVPQVKDEEGKDSGSINQQLATWCIKQGFDVALYTFDCQIIDQAWTGLSPQDIVRRLELGLGSRGVPALGMLWSDAYRQSYVDYMLAGGKLYIQPAVSSKLLYALLENGPIIPCISYSTMYGAGRIGEDSKPDDINGKAWNHTIVIYGVNGSGSFLVADPLRKPGLHIIEPDLMVAAISTAQIECDNLLFQISK